MKWKWCWLMWNHLRTFITLIPLSKPSPQHPQTHIPASLYMSAYVSTAGDNLKLNIGSKCWTLLILNLSYLPNINSADFYLYNKRLVVLDWVIIILPPASNANGSWFYTSKELVPLCNQLNSLAVKTLVQKWKHQLSKEVSLPCGDSKGSCIQ